MITFVCVLKLSTNSPSKYNKNDVLSLKNYIEKHYTNPHKFICLTDDISLEKDCEIVPLIKNWNSWWSKLELFQYDFGDTVYFDLDTIIQKNINWVEDLDFSKFYGTFIEANVFENKLKHNDYLQAFSSNIMAWSGKREELLYYDNSYEKYWKNFLMNKYGDQSWIFNKMHDKNSFKYIDGDKLCEISYNSLEKRKKSHILMFSGYNVIRPFYTYNEKYKTFVLDLDKKNIIKLLEQTERYRTLLFFEYFNQPICSIISEYFCEEKGVKEIIKNQILYYQYFFDIIDKIMNTNDIKKINNFFKKLNAKNYDVKYYFLKDDIIKKINKLKESL